MVLPQGHGLPLPVDGGGDGDGDGVVRISGLPEVLLLQVLVPLGCAREAARTAVLARRWRDLSSRLPEYTFRGVEPESVEAALAQVTRPALDRLDIEAELSSQGAIWRASSLLRAAARLQPEKFCATLSTVKGAKAIELPCFDRARSFVLHGMPGVTFTPPATGTGGFTNLQNLEFTTGQAIPDKILNR